VSSEIKRQCQNVNVQPNRIVNAVNVVLVVSRKGEPPDRVRGQRSAGMGRVGVLVMAANVQAVAAGIAGNRTRGRHGNERVVNNCAYAAGQKWYVRQA